MNKSLCSSICVGVVYLILVGHANAALIYDETIDGDLNSSVAINLLTGQNTVKGSLGHFDVPNSNADIFENDPFQFVVQNGTQLDSIQITLTNINYLGPLFLSSGVSITGYDIQPWLSDENSNFLGFTDDCGLTGLCPLIINGVPLGTPLTYSFSNLLSLSSGIYHFGHGQGGAFASVDYEINFSVSGNPIVSTVPEPSIFLLMGLGLTGLIGFSRYRKRLSV